MVIKMNKDSNILISFLINAKMQTYANENAPKTNSSRLGSKDYEFSKETELGTMVYHDTYFGGINFLGEEVVYINSDTPCWGMNYYGNTISNIGEDIMDKILRPALMLVGTDQSIIPVRGPSLFENDEYKYTFKTEGTIDNFTGIEEIHKGKELIYRLRCQGGKIN